MSWPCLPENEIIRRALKLEHVISAVSFETIGDRESQSEIVKIYVLDGCTMEGVGILLSSPASKPGPSRGTLVEYKFVDNHEAMPFIVNWVRDATEFYRS